MNDDMFKSKKISFCYKLILGTIGSSNIRIVDLCFLLWNTIFIVFLTLKFCCMRASLRRSNNKIICCILLWVIVMSVIDVIASLLNISIKNETLNKVSWIIARYFLMSLELSLLIMGFVYSRHNNQPGLGRIIAVVASVAGVHAVVQGLLDLGSFFPNDHVYVFAFGNPRLITFSSALFLLVYICVIIILACCRNSYLKIPSYIFPKKYSVYIYCSFLLIIYASSWIGAVFYMNHYENGLCAINFGSLLYCLLYTPLVYFLLLRGHFSVEEGPFGFMYRRDLYQRRSGIGLSVNSGDIRYPAETIKPEADRLLDDFESPEMSSVVESEATPTVNRNSIGVIGSRLEDKETPIILNDMEPSRARGSSDHLVYVSHQLMAVEIDEDFYTGQLDPTFFNKDPTSLK